MKKPLYLISFMITIIITLSIIRVGVINSIATTGAELTKLQSELDVYKKQNLVLEESYLELSSLTNLEKRAETLGFVEAKSPVYLNSPLPLALR
jgi:cell division protein FtsL